MPLFIALGALVLVATTSVLVQRRARRGGARPIVVAWFIAVFGSGFSTGLAFLPVLRRLNAEWVCGGGAEIRVSSVSLGAETSYGLYCSTDPHLSLWPYYLTVGVGFVSVVLTAGLLTWAAGRLRARGRES